MSFLQGLFRTRDAPQNRTSGSAYSFPMHRLCFAVICKDMVSSFQRRNYYYEYNQR